MARDPRASPHARLHLASAWQPSRHTPSSATWASLLTTRGKHGYSIGVTSASFGTFVRHNMLLPQCYQLLYAIYYMLLLQSADLLPSRSGMEIVGLQPAVSLPFFLVLRRLFPETCQQLRKTLWLKLSPLQVCGKALAADLVVQSITNLVDVSHFRPSHLFILWIWKPECESESHPIMCTCPRVSTQSCISFVWITGVCNKKGPTWPHRMSNTTRRVDPRSWISAVEALKLQ